MESKEIIDTNETICINPKGGRGGIDGLQPSLQDRIYDINGVAPAVTVCFHPNILLDYSFISLSNSSKNNKKGDDK